MDFETKLNTFNKNGYTETYSPNSPYIFSQPIVDREHIPSLEYLKDKINEACYLSEIFENIKGNSWILHDYLVKSEVFMWFFGLWSMERHNSLELKTATQCQIAIKNPADLIRSAQATSGNKSIWIYDDGGYILHDNDSTQRITDVVRRYSTARQLIQIDQPKAEPVIKLHISHVAKCENNEELFALIREALRSSNETATPV